MCCDLCMLDSRGKTKGGWFFILGFNMLKPNMSNTISIGTCSSDLYIHYFFETSGTASCGTTGIYIYIVLCTVFTIHVGVYIFMYIYILYLYDICRAEGHPGVQLPTGIRWPLRWSNLFCHVSRGKGRFRDTPTSRSRTCSRHER